MKKHSKKNEKSFGISEIVCIFAPSNREKTNKIITDMNELEILKEIKDWVDSSHAYLSSSTPYAQGFKDGITRAKEIISDIIETFENETK